MSEAMREQLTGEGQPLDNRLAFWVQRVHQAMQMAAYDAFRAAKVELTPEQWEVLGCLWELDGQTQSALSEMTLRDKPTMSRMVVGLEKRGLVTRRGSPSDARAKHVFLTKEGRALRSKMTPIAKALSEQMYGGLARVELSQTCATLQGVFENIRRRSV